MKNDNYCLLKHNRLVSSLWGKNRRGPSKLSALQVEEWKKKIQFNAPLGAKRFSKCLFTSFFSRIFLASAVPEKKDFELYFSFFFWHRWSLAWNHNFPMNVKKKKTKTKGTCESERDEWHCTRHMAYDSVHVVLLQSLLNRVCLWNENAFFGVSLFYFGMVYVCLLCAAFCLLASSANVDTSKAFHKVFRHDKQTPRKWAEEFEMKNK